MQTRSLPIIRIRSCLIRRRPPLGPFATLLRDRANSPREHRVFRLDRLRTFFGWLCMLARIHANRIARAGLHTQPTHDATQLVDLEDRRALLDAFRIAFFGYDRDAVR